MASKAATDIVKKADPGNLVKENVSWINRRERKEHRGCIDRINGMDRISNTFRAENGREHRRLTAAKLAQKQTKETKGKGRANYYCLRVCGVLRLRFQGCHRIYENPAKRSEKIDGGKHPEIGVPIIMGGFKHERNNHRGQSSAGVTHHIHAAGKRTGAPTAYVHASTPRPRHR